MIPAILLCVVAIVQVYLTRAENLTPWKGGGFGMFSSNDDGLNRTIRVRIHGSDYSRDLDVPSVLANQAYRASVLPSDGRLAALGREIAGLEAASGQSIASVRIAVWRLSYDPRTLVPQLDVVRDVVVPGSDSGRGS